MKNKILKILSLIAICTLMIASLCSFTTVAPPEDTDIGEYDDIYTSSMDLKVGYCYSRVTSTISQNYYGYFIDPNATIVFDNDVSTVKNFASDYLVTGTKSFDYHSQSDDDLPSKYKLSGDYLYSEVVIESDDSSTQWFTGSLIYSGLQKISDIDPFCEVCFYDESINGFEPLDMSSYYYSFSISVVNFEDENYTTTKYGAFEYASEVVGDFGGINLRKVIDLCLDENDATAQYIDYVRITSADDNFFYCFPMIKIIDILRPDTMEGEREYGWVIDYLDSITTYLKNEIAALELAAQDSSERYNELVDTYNLLITERDNLLARVKDFEEGNANVLALPLLFDGIYKTIYNVLTIFFNMDFFGAKLGNVVGLLLGAAVVIIILKVVL